MNKCSAKNNLNVLCDGEYIESEGCCLKHSILFDYWIAECDGFKVYNTSYPYNWKRSKFHKWLNTLKINDVEKILNS